MSAPTTVSEVLTAAADYMAEHGWTRDYYVDSAGRVCLMGACAAAIAGDEPSALAVRSPLLKSARAALQEHLDSVGCDELTVSGWNDCQCANQGEAVGLLRKVAEVAAEQQRPYVAPSPLFESTLHPIQDPALVGRDV